MHVTAGEESPFWCAPCTFFRLNEPALAAICGAEALRDDELRDHLGSSSRNQRYMQQSQLLSQI
jgi:hypothetical protein